MAELKGLSSEMKRKLRKRREQKERAEGQTASDFPELSKAELEQRKKMLELGKKKRKRQGF